MLRWLAVDSPSVDPFNFAQLGVSAVVCALLLAIALTLWRQLLASQQRERTLLDEARARERELAERTIPILVEESRLLRTLPERVEQMLDKARDR